MFKNNAYFLYLLGSTNPKGEINNAWPNKAQEVKTENAFYWLAKWMSEVFRVQLSRLVLINYTGNQNSLQPFSVLTPLL